MSEYAKGYANGFQAAYSEIYSTIDNDSHPAICGGHCRPCGLIRTALEDGLWRLAAQLTEGEKIALARMLKRVNQEGQKEGAV